MERGSWPFCISGAQDSSGSNSFSHLKLLLCVHTYPPLPPNVSCLCSGSRAALHSPILQHTWAILPPLTIVPCVCSPPPPPEHLPLYLRTLISTAKKVAVREK